MTNTIEIILNSSVALLIAGALIKGIHILYKEYIVKRRGKTLLKRDEDYANKLRSIANVYSIMDKIRFLKNVDRVFLLEVANGGNSPRVGSKMFARGIEIKVDEEVSNTTRDSLLKKYGEVLLDEGYINMCIKILHDKFYDFNTAEEAGGLLKQYYLSEGVNHSRIFHIYTDHTEEKMFIMSVGSFREDKLDDPKLKDIIQSDVNEIRDYFRKYRENNNG